MAEFEPGPPAARPAAPVVTGPPYNIRLVLAIWFITGLFDALIGIRFLLRALGASTASSFTSFIYGVTQPLVAPFQGIFPQSAHGFYVLEPGALVAIVIYALIGWGLVSLVKIITGPRGRRSAID